MENFLTNFKEGKLNILESIGDWTSDQLRKNGTKYLRGVGYTGIFMTPVIAAIGGWKAHEEVEKRKKDRNIEDLPLEEKAVIIAKNEAVAAVTTVTTAVSFWKLDRERTKTIESLTTAGMALKSEIKDMKEAEKEVVGKEKAEEIQQKADEKRKTSECITNPAKIYKCKDSFTGQIGLTTLLDFKRGLNWCVGEIARKQIMKVNDLLNEVFINKVDCERNSQAGNMYGWDPEEMNMNPANIEIWLDSEIDEDGDLTYVIKYGACSEPMPIY